MTTFAAAHTQGHTVQTHLLTDLRMPASGADMHSHKRALSTSDAQH